MRNTVWVVGILLVLCLNIAGALPRMYKLRWHPVGSDVAHVREPQGHQGEILVPVQTIGSDRIPVDSEHRVQVYIRTNYKDDIITFYPRATLLIVAGTGFLNWMLWIWNRRHSKVGEGTAR